MLVIFKIGTYIPAPGVNPEAFNHPQGSQGATELLNTFGGGALKRFSIFAMGIMPISPHPLLCNYCKWILCLSLQNGLNKVKWVEEKLIM